MCLSFLLLWARERRGIICMSTGFFLLLPPFANAVTAKSDGGKMVLIFSSLSFFSCLQEKKGEEKRVEKSREREMQHRCTKEGKKGELYISEIKSSVWVCVCVRASCRLRLAAAETHLHNQILRLHSLMSRRRVRSLVYFRIYLWGALWIKALCKWGCKSCTS